MSTYKIFLPILIIILVFGLFGNLKADTHTGVLKGRLIDSLTGQPVSYAKIELLDTEFKTQTDIKGEFCIINIPAQEYNLKITAHGYCSVTIVRAQVLSACTTVINYELTKLAKTEQPRKISFFASEVQEIEGKDIIFSNDHLPVTEADEENFSIKDNLACKPKVGVPALYHRKYADPTPVGQGQWLPHGGTTPPNGKPYSGTFFKHHGVTPFVDTEDDHFSTFAIDVDDASYSVARGYLERGHLPEPASVRTEEFVNFFNYDYAPPRDQRFNVFVEGAPSYFGQNCELFRVGIKGQVIDPVNRKPAVLTFVIDISGSMNIDSRLGLVKQALKILVDNLKPNDLVGIAVYGSRGLKILDHTSIQDKDKILLTIESLCSEGSTNAEEGIKIGYEMASASFKPGAINRIILCSDGVANVGRTGPDAILKEIQEYVKKGITLTSVGFGMDNYNDVLLEKLGDKGNGHFAYVDNLQQAKRIFMQNLTGTLQVIARDVKIQVDFDPEKVQSYRLLGYENRDVADDKFRDDKEDGGEIGSGHDVTALYEIKLRKGASGKFATVYMRYKEPDDETEVTEQSFPVSMNDYNRSFEKTTSSFRLAACAAEFAEIMRESYWAKDGDLGEVLALAQRLSYESQDNDDLIEFTAMVSRAKMLWDEKELLSSDN